MYQKEEIEAWKEFDEDDLVKTNDDASSTNYPKHQKAGGKPYGLSILVNPELDMYSTCNTNDAVGFKVTLYFYFVINKFNYIKIKLVICLLFRF